MRPIVIAPSILSADGSPDYAAAIGRIRNSASQRMAIAQ
jgi:hypothetical protein